MPHIADLTALEMSPYNAHAFVKNARDGRVLLDEPRTKVAIVGAGFGKEYAPYDDPDWEVWSLNAVPCLDRFGRLRADRWFEMHVMAAQSKKDMDWIRRCPFPLYLVPQATRDWSAHEFNPQQVRYPIERVEAACGSYFAVSFAYEIALALSESFTDIGLYGCELCYGDARERTVEWACVSWWLGYAEAKGHNIHLPPMSHLGRHRYRYGIDYYEEKADVENYVALMQKADVKNGVGG